MTEYIESRGARENDLKYVTLRIPKRRITIFTGIPGSGKSSIVFDTIATEAQRQLYENFSMFIQELPATVPAAGADAIENLSMDGCVGPERWYAPRVSIPIAAAAGFAFAVAAVILFQVGLALGAPWGRYAMGGRFPDRLPPAMRALALVQAALLALLAGVVLSDAGLLVPQTARAYSWLIWLPVGVSGIALLLNTITPSVGERRIWAPVAALLLITSLVVALSH